MVAAGRAKPISGVGSRLLYGEMDGFRTSFKMELVAARQGVQI